MVFWGGFGLFLVGFWLGMFLKDPQKRTNSLPPGIVQNDIE